MEARKSSEADFFGTQNIWKIIAKIAPPVMIAQLIQALYNIVDSFFVGQYSGAGLTALSAIFPIQLIVTALAVGTGVGVNTIMSRYYAMKKIEDADKAGGTGVVVAIIMWVIFSIFAIFLVPAYAKTSSESKEAIDYATTYGLIVCIGSLGIFLESIWSKVHQAKGNMIIPMVAQIAGAITNIILDPLLIFGYGIFPELGIAGAAYATIIGQCVAAVITGIRGFKLPPKINELPKYSKIIFKLGYPSILMQLLYSVYIIVLTIILANFSDAAVTVLGLYYKLQTFFFIPLIGLQTCIVPVISYNITIQRADRVLQIMKISIIISMVFMILGILSFEFIPAQLIGIFSSDADVISIGVIAFRIIAISFIPAVISLMSPVFFQAIGKSVQSTMLSITRQLFCLIPIFFAFSFIGLNYVWIAFPLAEVITSCLAIVLFVSQIRLWKKNNILSPTIEHSIKV